jgi:hypothetical protein
MFELMDEWFTTCEWNERLVVAMLWAALCEENNQ